MYKTNTEYRKAVKEKPLYGLPLFEPEKFGLDPLPRVINDAEEVKAKALKVLEHYLEDQQWQVYLGFKKVGPCTDYDVSRLLGIERSSVCGRRNTLVKYGLIEKHDIIKVERGKRIVENARWRVVVRVPDNLLNKRIKEL